MTIARSTLTIIVFRKLSRIPAMAFPLFPSLPTDPTRGIALFRDARKAAAPAPAGG
jgi:hypothetical protein